MWGAWVVAIAVVAVLVQIHLPGRLVAMFYPTTSVIKLPLTNWRNLPNLAWAESPGEPRDGPVSPYAIAVPKVRQHNATVSASSSVDLPVSIASDPSNWYSQHKQHVSCFVVKFLVTVSFHSLYYAWLSGDFTQEALDDLSRRLSQFRTWDLATPMPHGRDTTDWSWGIAPLNVSIIVSHWRLNYSWHAAQAQLNQDLFSIRIDGLRIVFKHLKPLPRNKQRPPVLLLHGWPGSIVEFGRIQELLKNDGHAVVVPCAFPCVRTEAFVTWEPSKYIQLCLSMPFDAIDD